MQLYNTIQHEPLRFPASPEISPQLRDLLTCLLQKDPSARITMPEIFQHPWVTLGANLPLYSLQVQILSILLAVSGNSTTLGLNAVLSLKQE